MYQDPKRLMMALYITGNPCSLVNANLEFLVGETATWTAVTLDSDGSCSL